MEIVDVLIYPGDTMFVFAQVNGETYILWNLQTGEDTPAPEEP